jgi:hypothetical protein
MKTTIIKICDFLIDHISGNGSDNLLTAFLGGIANNLNKGTK